MITFNDKVITYNGSWIKPKPKPLNRVRVKTISGDPPSRTGSNTFDYYEPVPGYPGEYYVYKSGTDWSYLLNWNLDVCGISEIIADGVTNMSHAFELIQLLDNPSLGTTRTIPYFDSSSVTDMSWAFRGSSLKEFPLIDTSNVTDMNHMLSETKISTIPLLDTSKVTNMSSMFLACSSLESIPLIDTSNVTDMSDMFTPGDETVHSSLKTVPLLNTSKVTNMNGMFAYCTNVESGALALYQQASTQTNPPTNHYYTFLECGSATQTGAAELAQISSDWK